MSQDHEDDPTAVAALLAKAGRRVQPPPETRDAVYVSALVAWRQVLQEKRQKRRWAFALAAGLAAVAVATLWFLTTSREPLQIAAWSVDGQEMRVGAMVRASALPGQVLVTPAGDRLRAAVGAEMAILESNRLELRSGSLYFESAAGTNAAGLVIETAYGAVRHVGTRYAVEIGADTLTVSVRDGLVAIDTLAQQIAIGAGVQVVVNRQGEETVRHRINRFGSLWAWTEGLAPALQIDGRLLDEVLREIAFETGRRLEFADEEVRIACGQIRLKGPFLDMAASDRLFAVLVTTGLEATESGERIQIRRQTASTARRPVPE
jgi:ferric-dicitrate binding protein FerR (iron transport regulator)